MAGQFAGTAVETPALDTQVTVVGLLQARLTTEGRFRADTGKPGEVKDLALGLGCAIDKLVVLADLHDRGVLKQVA